MVGRKQVNRTTFIAQIPSGDSIVKWYVRVREPFPQMSSETIKCEIWLEWKVVPFPSVELLAVVSPELAGKNFRCLSFTGISSVFCLEFLQLKDDSLSIFDLLT